MTSEYNAGNISVLEGLDAVRKRPGMYIGSTDSAGLTHCLVEILDNSADEAGAGYAHHIDVVLNTDTHMATVTDDGRGIPTDINQQTGLSGVELVLTKLHAGGKFNDDSYAAAGGLHGVGAAVVNALSTTMTATVTRDGGVHEQTFHHGNPAGKLKEIGTAPKKAHGTRITFTPDMDLFTDDATYLLETIRERLHHLTHLLPGLCATLTVETAGGTVASDFPATTGLADLLTHLLAGRHALTEPITVSATGQFSEKVPTVTESGTKLVDTPRTVRVEAAFTWTAQPGTDIVSYVNTIRTRNGGTHVGGFERALVKTLAGLAKTGDHTPTKDDVTDNLVAVLRVQLPEPQFAGQTKTQLSTRDVSAIVADSVTNQVGAWMAARRNKLGAKAVVDIVALNTKTRLAAKDARDANRKRASITNSSTLPAKLVDCRSRDTNLNELFIVEGDSALGTVKGARDSNTQAALPIRGKILNVARASERQMLSNAECASIISVIGAGSGKTFTLDKMRYGRIIALVDADVDGSHIRCLLLTLFYRYMRPMLDAGLVYAAVPPLHMVKTGSGKKQQVTYTYTDAELKTLLDRLRSEGAPLTDSSIQRYKGLGEMDADQLAETTLDPAYRHLRRITVSDAAAASTMFDVCMGADPSVRREYIISKAPELDPANIDS
jgi:DNA gyrase subunit B